jgi:hypothetical protein
MKRETIKNILNFLKEKEGNRLPEKWIKFLAKEKLIQELETHPDGTKYRYNGNLDLRDSNIIKLPSDLYVKGWFQLTDCKQITELPDTLYLAG